MSGLRAFGEGALANVGSGCVTPDRRPPTVGTPVALPAVDSAPPTHIPPGLWCYRLDGGRVVIGGALSNGGNLRKWFVDTLRLQETKLEDALNSMVPGAHGLTVLPHFAGERSLGYAPHAFGAIAGITSATTAEHIALAELTPAPIQFPPIAR